MVAAGDLVAGLFVLLHLNLFATCGERPDGVLYFEGRSYPRKACIGKVVQPDEAEGTPCDPAGTFCHPIGFDIPHAELIQSIRFQCRLQTARAASKDTESSLRNRPTRQAA